MWVRILGVHPRHPSFKQGPQVPWCRWFTVHALRPVNKGEFGLLPPPPLRCTSASGTLSDTDSLHLVHPHQVGCWQQHVALGICILTRTALCLDSPQVFRRLGLRLVVLLGAWSASLLRGSSSYSPWLPQSVHWEMAARRRETLQ